jgi:hypothetical protein
MERQPNIRMSFVCGIENPIGLHLALYTDDIGRCITHFRPKLEHQGYPGSLPEGVTSISSDEPTQSPVHFGSLFVRLCTT